MFVRQLIAILLLCAAACSQPPADKAAATTTESDSNFIADLTPVDNGAAEVAAAEIAKTDAGNACPGGSGCACATSTDCDNALCIEDPNVDGGLACASKCVTDCPSGYACAPVTAAGGDITTICVPKFVRLCDPCTVSKDCEGLGLKDSACVEEGALGRFCGVSCGDAGDCPKDFGCQEVATAEGGKLKQCMRLPEEGSKLAFGTCTCSAKAVAKKLATACYVEAKDADGKVTGKCAGTRACESKGLSGCSAPPAVAEICDGVDNDCNGQTDESSCDDKNVCTTDVCDGKGGCSHANKSGVACDADGSVCTENDACKDGVCVAGSVKDCDDKNPCTTDSCDMAKGCTQVADDGKPCDADGNLCTQGDVCAVGTCKAGGKVDCDDQNPCTSDGCDKKTGQCTSAALDDGIPCDDGTKCTDKDSCKGGICKGKAVSCDDSNPCTDDVCDSKLGCQISKLSGAPCDDDNLCTVGDLCQVGECQPGSAKNCVSPDACYVSKCNLLDGKCKVSEAADGVNCDDGNACTAGDGCKGGNCTGIIKACDDGNPCTDDKCDQKLGCVHGANAAPCDADGDACTIGDTCANKACLAGAKKVCDDKELCTVDSCDPTSGLCVFKGLAQEGKGCDADGNVCTVDDACKSGACAAGLVLGCDDKNPCTTDSCDAKIGCVHAVNAVACDADGDACTLNDGCKDQACLPGSKKLCNDGEFCTADSCDKGSGICVFDGLAQVGQGCDADGSVCTVGDSCDGGKCLAGKLKICDDGNLCTDDTCDGKAGCVSAPNQAPCDDGSACTKSDACAAGTCAAGGKVDCDDKNVCTTDSCDAVKGCSSVANSIACADGNACTSGDVCGGGKCAGIPVVCDDKDPCTADSCDAVKGCVAVTVADKVDCSLNGKNWCVGGKCVAKQVCGDGVVNQAGEECDDGNVKDGDGCSAACKLEGPIWSLASEWALSSKPLGAIVANGGFGGQGVANLGGANCWNQTSDWNYLWIPHPAPAANRIRVEVDVYANTGAWGITLFPLVDGPQYIPDTYIVNGVGVNSSANSTTIWQTIGYKGTSLAALNTGLPKQNTWVTVRQDLDRTAKTTTLYRDNVLLGSWPVNLEAAKGDKLLLNSGVPFAGSNCWKNLKVYTAP